ncbi:hypothetical protein [Caproiciproducens sp. CPB-2]|uniref:hypothetical protein n=1 Tax=Caproiciproducens sp. CPB-2 TaxID=3030017 RepID=UPI0023DBE352|nr:hypothetical protein [Caproiciproducens sp. CPB-2]MDF1495475.1 hypothetical protein [Caproiciproducens sp. CPB-2]
MKKTTNKVQDNYMKAKAVVESIESRQKEIERQYIADKGIVNPDGSIPELLYCMEDDAAFETANEECSAIIVSAGLESELNAASAVLKTAEEKLIEYGLSIAPAGVRAVLQEEVKKNACTRMKVIDLVFRLDASTVRM